MFLLLFFISLFCFSVYSQINPVVTPSYTTLAVGASSLNVEYNYNFTRFTDYELQLFVNNEPIENITCSQSCSGYANDMRSCSVTANFNSIAANYLGSNLTACVIVNNVTSSNATVAVVVPPPIIQSAQPIYLFQNTFLLYGENLGQGCNAINIKPFFITGYVYAYSSNGTVLEITLSSTITSNYFGQYVNLSVFCSGVWSNVLVANKLEYAPVDTTSSVICGGTQNVIVQNRNPISCFIYIRGNGMERQGNISSFVITVDSGTTSDFTQVDNYTIQFYYAAPAVTSSIIANLTVVEVNSQQNIINSPLAMTISKNTEPKKKHLGKPLFLGLIIGVPAAVIIILIIIVVLLKRRKNSHYQRIG